MSLTAKGNVRLEEGENTSITTTENKFSSASIGASFTPQGLSNISVNASKGNGNSKESVTAYSPALVSAQNNLSLFSGKDMDIIGSRAQGDRITAKVGGNLNIETLQEKETYEEQNSSTGFGFSWSVKAKDKQTSTKSTGQTQNPPTTNAANSTPKPNGTQVTSPTGRKFFDPTIGGSRNKGTVDSHYRSARDQAGFFAGNKGFDIYVEKNTNLKGGIIASEASADKNRLSTGTFSFSDLKNEADYSAKSTGSAYHKYGNYDNMSEDEQNKVFNTIGLAPVLPMPVVGSADSTTKAAVAPAVAAVAPATIDIRENPTQDISALSRDTVNALNELGRIFDKQTMEERQELAAVFGEEAFRLLHNMKDDGSVGKIAAHAAVAGILSQITGNGFTSGAIGAGLNEALIKALDGKDPGTAQLISAIIGAAAAKVAGGNALAGASAAASGTKWNSLLTESDFVRECIRDDDLVKNLPEGTCNLIAVSGGDAVSLSGMIMVFNVEGTPVYSSYNIEGGVSAFVGAYTMGRGYLEDPQGNIVTDPEILKEQLTGFSMGWSAGFGLEHGQSTNVNGYSFIYNAVSSTPTISLSAGWVFYEGNQKDF